jgi:hypothetical protein
VHRIPQPPVITQEISSTQSARTSVASGGRLSILSEKLSRLSISSNQSGRPSVASDSVLLHKKGESGRLSHSYDDTDTQAITAHYSGRRSSKVPRISSAGIDTQAIGLGSPPGESNSRNIRFQLFPRTSDAVEQSLSSVDQSSTTGIGEDQLSSKRPLAKTDSSQIGNTGRRQSLLRSPSSRCAIPKFPIVGKQISNITRASMPPPEQGLLSPPISSPASSYLIKNKTLRGALGAIMPDLYFVGAACSGNNIGIGTSGNIGAFIGERTNEELPTVEENLHRLHVRIQYDDHRNDLIVNIIEGRYRNQQRRIFFLFVFSVSLAQYLPFDREDSANPYVKLYLRPPVDQKLRQTSVQPQTINPIWNEYFKFGVANETVFKTAKTLYLYIYNYAHASRPECVGEAQIRLTPQTIHGCDLWLTINKQRAVSERIFCVFFYILKES